MHSFFCFLPGKFRKILNYYHQIFRYLGYIIVYFPNFINKSFRVFQLFLFRDRVRVRLRVRVPSFPFRYPLLTITPDRL